MISPISHLPSDDPASPHWLARIREAVQATDYGSVTIKIHDGRVVEIESARKWRLQAPASTNRIHHSGEPSRLHPLPTTRVEASHKKPHNPIPAVHFADRNKEINL